MFSLMGLVAAVTWAGLETVRDGTVLRGTGERLTRDRLAEFWASDVAGRRMEAKRMRNGFMSGKAGVLIGCEGKRLWAFFCLLIWFCDSNEDWMEGVNRRSMMGLLGRLGLVESGNFFLRIGEESMSNVGKLTVR